jgi:hypothetical protein
MMAAHSAKNFLRAQAAKREEFSEPSGIKPEAGTDGPKNKAVGAV